MKTTRILTLVAAFALAAALPSAAQHDHEESPAGPNRGRVLTAVEPHIEFFVTPERKVQLTFLGADGKVIAPAGQSVAVICGDRANPTRLSFEKVGETLLSAQPLPAGNDFPTVVQIKTAPDAKAVVEKFNLNLSLCPSCKFQEYACGCEH